MKRPTTTQGRIRYYGIMMAEITADLMDKKVLFTYNISPRYVTASFWSGKVSESVSFDWGKITKNASAWFNDERELDQFENWIESTVAELTSKEVQP